MKIISKVELLKVGKITQKKLQNQKRDLLISAIEKFPIKKSYLSKTKFVDDDFADKTHHGGEDKAVFFMSSLTYDKINRDLNTDLTYEKNASLGENILVKNIDESSVFLGDIWQIGDAIVQISQPRQPCWKLSANVDKKEMTKFIFKNGLTGWYARVLQVGEIKTGDDIVLKTRIYEHLSILDLNLALVNPKNYTKLIKEALNAKELGKAFKTSLYKRYKFDDIEQFEYQN